MDKGSAKERLIIKLVCVLLSFGLWIYVTNVETVIKTYTLKNVPVQVTNIEALKNQGLALAPGQKFNVDLNLEGPSKEIYSVKPSNFIIKADLGEYALKKGINNIPVQIINYPQQINIKNNGYLVVQVKLEALETRTFNSTSNVNITFAQNVYKDKVNFTSEKVDVTGAESLVNEVKQVALVGSLSNVVGPMAKTFKYEALNARGQVVEGVNLSQTEGTITVEASQGKKVSLEPQLTGNLPQGVTLKGTLLSQKYVYIVGKKESLNEINSLNLEPIDLSKIEGDTKKTVNIMLPEGVKIASGDASVSVSINVSGEVQPQKPDDVAIKKSFEIPVKYDGIDSSLKLESSSAVVSIEVNGPTSIINAMSNSDFTATVDLSSYKNVGDFSITPKITVDKNVAIQTIPNISVKLVKSEANKTVVKNDKE